MENLTEEQIEQIKDEFDEAMSDARHALLQAIRLSQKLPEDRRPPRSMAADTAYHSIC